MGATTKPSRSHAVIASSSTDRLVRSRPTMVMNPAAPTSAAAMYRPSGQRELKLKIEPMSLPPAHRSAGLTTLTATKHANMSTVESQGFPNTGRRGTSAALRAEGSSAARTEFVLSGSVAKSAASTRNLRQPFRHAALLGIAASLVVPTMAWAHRPAVRAEKAAMMYDAAGQCGGLSARDVDVPRAHPLRCAVADIATVVRGLHASMG
jgi:hypothetical protein